MRFWYLFGVFPKISDKHPPPPSLGKGERKRDKKTLIIKLPFSLPSPFPPLEGKDIKCPGYAQGRGDGRQSFDLTDT